ncbi:hypothetical protein [uncultured Cardiobacterium sp.]|uniref:hypothetical protein n=1 Tax=uncultured Cardiobacterium sp. TaxID=417619 RepID=UPI00261B057B|nr:hypothetical protein [uncultured Cardiobacterium sp.]
MDWNKLGAVAIGAYFIYLFYREVKNGGYKALMERSRNAPQHWGTFAFLVAMVVLFVIFLIKM